MAGWRKKRGLTRCVHSERARSVTYLCEWQVSVMKRGRREPELDIIWTPVGSLCFFVCLHLQFQNNNNYMNMAEANGALLAAGDVSMLCFFFFFCYILKFPLAQIGNSTECKHTVWFKCRQVQWGRSSSWYPVLYKSSQKSYLSKDTVSMYYFCESPIHIVLVCKLCTWWWVGVGFVSFRIIKPDQSSSLTFSIILIIRIGVW